MIDAGVHVAIATNCNPGSSYTTSMAFCIALAVRDMRMTIEEALLAATLGGARGAAPRRRRPPRARAPAPTPSCSTRRPTRTSSTGPGVPLVGAVVMEGQVVLLELSDQTP